MDIDTLVESIHDNLCRNGGDTVTLAGERPTTGYAASTERHRHAARTVTLDTIHRYINDNYDCLSNDRAHIGVWQSPDGVYFDVTYRFEDRASAEHFGVMHAQLAIFDLTTGETIYLPDPVLGL